MADEQEVEIRPPSTTFDFATVFGLIAAAGLIIIAIVLGGSPGAFIDTRSVLIVIGGTLAVTTVCFSFEEMVKTAGVIVRTIFRVSREPSEAAIQVLQLAQMARRRGVLSLQDILDSLRGEPFLHKGIAMVVDGTPGDEVEGIMRRDILATAERNLSSANVLRRAAEFSPAMGLIGTLVGLVQMLSNLDDPSTIGPSMALALLTTFYGAVLANVVFIPLASKLERNSAQEEMVNNVYLMGASSIGRQENPRRLEMLLNSVMPPSDRIRYFE